MEKTATNHVTLASWLEGGAVGKWGRLGKGSGENDFSEVSRLFVSPLSHGAADCSAARPVDGAEILSVLLGQRCKTCVLPPPPRPRPPPLRARMCLCVFMNMEVFEDMSSGVTPAMPASSYRLKRSRSSLL